MLHALVLACTALVCSNAEASGFSFALSDDALVVAVLLPALAGITTGCLAGWRRWHFWKTLAIVAGLVTAVLAAIFLRRLWILFAPVAIPVLLLVHCALHATSHTAWAWYRKRRARAAAAGGRDVG